MATKLTLDIKANVTEAYCFLAWNVDRYNDIIHSWMKPLLQNSRPDVVFLSETKEDYDTLRRYFEDFTEYNYIINVHDPKRYHGVAMLIRKDRKYTQFNIDLKVQARSDTKDGNPVTGRLIAFQFEDQYIVVGTYVPNSGVRNDRERKLPYRINVWDPALHALLNVCRSSKPTIWLGDINVAPEDLDVSNPKTMCKMSGFTPEERHSFRQFMSTPQTPLGSHPANSFPWVDIWRMQHPSSREYSWRSYSPRPNYGMRLDNIIVSSEVVPYVLNTFMMHDCIPNSDHIPVGAYIRQRL